jgi:hypothetical protein
VVRLVDGSVSNSYKEVRYSDFTAR